MKSKVLLVALAAMLAGGTRLYILFPYDKRYKTGEKEL